MRQLYSQRSGMRLALSAAVVAMAAVTAHADPFFIAGPAANNVDTNPGTQVILISNVVGTIADLNLSVNITGGHMEDFDLFLTSPLGTTIQVHDAETSEHLDGPFDITFDDEAALPHSAIAAGAPIAVGTFQSFVSLSAFDGEELFGDWTLTISDTFTPDEGDTLVSWSISGDTVVAAGGAPEPGTLALLGTGMLLGGIAVRRRLR